VAAPNALHRAFPTVCAPESETRSAGSASPAALKADRSSSTVAVGGGSLNTSLSEAGARLSRRPRETEKAGPPARLTASRVASTVMSAHETVAPH
jgi:hypothetical protein